MDDAALSVWLRLRELRDWQARSTRLTEAIAAALPKDRPVSLLDLATGAGSNLRYLAERLPAAQRWLLVDRSAALIADGEARTRTWAAARGHTLGPVTGAGFMTGFTIAGPAFDCRIETRVLNLGPLDDASIFAGRDLVTASALLDLVSESWLRALAARCRAAGANALFTLTYDGRFSCSPPEPEDEQIRALMNRHQHRDKGLGGPAEGPDAAACAARCFAAEGYDVTTETSDWVLGPEDAAMQRTLIDGWAEAAAAVAPDDVDAIASWQARRLAHVDAGRSCIVVGHRDVAAWIE